MLSFAAIRRVFVARQAQDMRRGVDSLVTVVASQLGDDPYSGDCFVFLSRDRRRLKALIWESGGFWLCSKRLERGTFIDLMRGRDGPGLTVSPAQMHAMLEGLDVQITRRRRRVSGVAVCVPSV